MPGLGIHLCIQAFIWAVFFGLGRE